MTHGNLFSLLSNRDIALYEFIEELFWEKQGILFSGQDGRDADPDSPLKQNNQGLHKLELVHITKTGGTSIEVAGKSLVYFPLSFPI